MKLATEIQIELDDVYACPGKCPGCVLTAEERKSPVPDMSKETRQTILSALADYIPTLQGLTSMNLTYGIADHLLMPTDYLVSIYKDAAELFDRVGLAGSGSIFMSTSVIGKTDMVKKKLTALAEAAKPYKTKLLPIVVLDPAKLMHASFGKTYAHHIAFAKELFGTVDLAINLSDKAIAQMSPRELVDFASTHGFREVTINWVPTSDNLKATYSKAVVVSLRDWLLAFAKEAEQVHVECSYVPVVKRAYEAWRCALDGEEGDGQGVMALAEQLLPETLSKSLQFDHAGNVFPKWEAVGDVPHNDRVGIPVWGNIHATPDLRRLIQAKMPKTIGVVLKAVAQSPCESCPYVGFCATTGFHAYTHVLKKANASGWLEDCPHVAKSLVEALTLTP
jgi:hypothetical protein